jgi:DNA-binding response OmpR family regulator
MHISWLRAKLAAAGVTEVVTTLRGVGYRFEDRPTP